MPRPFPLQLVLDLTERRTEARSRSVKLAHAEWLRARTRVVRLQQQRDRYNQGLSRRIRQGCGAEVAQEATEALRNYQQRLTEGRQAIELAYHVWQQTLGVWQAEKKKLEALQRLAERHAQDEARREEKRESRLHDELASKAAYQRIAPSQRQTGFLFSEIEQDD